MLESRISSLSLLQSGIAVCFWFPGDGLLGGGIRLLFG